MPDQVGGVITNLEHQVMPSPPGGETSRMPQARSRKNMLITQNSNESLLPELRRVSPPLDKGKPLPTSLQRDYVPDDVLFALTQPPPVADILGPPNRNRNLAVSNIPNRKAAANLWNHPKRREKFKHLTENTPCLCGAGKDISFLYDVAKDELSQHAPDAQDKSAIRMRESTEKKPPLTLPDTLIPTEYHIVKNKGVLGLEYNEDKYATQPVDHEKHLVVFPSLKPNSRYEVFQLKKTLETMLSELGIHVKEGLLLRGRTQMHNLLDLIKKEQNIYNIIFHEIIRQVSVECVERGELLAEVRDRYSNLFNQVPLQVKSLHEEVLAQRALDRRLTEELLRFKATITLLTDELSEVREHDRKVTEEAAKARTDLKNALAESQKNTGLLAEYHELYELQRKRLEHSVLMLTQEKEIWSTAAYSLALKVTEEHSLSIARRLHVSEKAWVKLATHFTVMLSDKDTETLTILQNYVDQWRDLVDTFDLTLREREEGMRVKIRQVQQGLQKCLNQLRGLMLNTEGFLIKTPDRETIENLHQDFKFYESVLSGQAEKLGGDTMLKGQELLLQVRKMMEGWTDAALQVFTRHRNENDINNPDHEHMLTLNQEVVELISQYQVRITGENGSATSLIHLASNLDSWSEKFVPMFQGANPLTDQEWLKLLKSLQTWDKQLAQTQELISSTQHEEQQGMPHTPIDVPGIMKQVQKWLSSATNGIDSEDGKMVEHVGVLHGSMVKWMVQILLRLAPDHPNHSPEARQAVLLGSTTLGELQTNARSLFTKLTHFSALVTRCCTDITLQMGQGKQEENANAEYKDLIKLKEECDTWIHTARLLLSELTGEPYLDLKPPSKTDSLVIPTSPAGQDKAEDEQDGEAGEQDGEAGEQKHMQYDGQQNQDEDEETKEEEDEAPQPQANILPPGGTALPKRQGTPSLPRSTPSFALSPSGSQPGLQSAQVPSGDQIEMLGADAYTHKARLQHTPNAPPSQDTSRPVSQRTLHRPDLPNTQQSYEGLAALDPLQLQLIASEERAQAAEQRAAEAEARLKQAEERISALERRFPRAPEPSDHKDQHSPQTSQTEVTEPATPQTGVAEVKQSPASSPTMSTVTVPPPKTQPTLSPPKQEKDKKRKSAAKKKK